MDESASIEIDRSKQDPESMIVQEKWNDICVSGIAIRSINQQEQSSDEEDGAEQQQQVHVLQRIKKGVSPHRFIEEINVVSIRVAKSKTEVIASEGQMDQSHRQRDGFADDEWDLSTNC